jgi:lysozyme
MDLDRLKIDQTIEEGRRYRAYPDPLTHGAPYTCGIGCTLGVTKDTAWDDAQIDSNYEAAVQTAINGLDRIAPWWRGLDTVRANVLIDMSFQLGAPRLSKFRMLFCACAVGNYDRAAEEMLNSTWAHQTPSRAAKLATRMRTGLFES